MIFDGVGAMLDDLESLYRLPDPPRRHFELTCRGRAVRAASRRAA
jgi:hypothetical protein